MNFVHYMNPVKNTQMNTTVYRARNERYAIDACLPQRHAIQAGKVGFHALSHGHYPGTRIEPAMLAGVSSLGYFDVIGAQDWGIPAHRNEGVEICYQETGESALTVDGKIYHITANTLSLTRPWQLHSLGDPHLKPGRLHWLILDVDVRRPNQAWKLPEWCVLTKEDQTELIRLLRGNEHPVWTATAEIGRIFAKLGKLVSKESPQQVISRIRINLNQLLSALLELIRSQNAPIDERLTTRRRVVELFLQELQHDPGLLSLAWTLDTMAGHCGMGRTAFSAYCRELINTTPLAALNRWRLERAADRLQSEPSIPVTTIALDAGYSSSQYFARKFHQHYGQSPRQWRQR